MTEMGGTRGNRSGRFSWQTVVTVLLYALSTLPTTETAEDQLTRKGRLALEYVEKVRNSACTGGTEETLPIDFDRTQWEVYADVAVRMSNFLTKLVIQGGNSLKNVNEEFIYNLLRTNVDNDTPIFGSGLPVMAYLFPKYYGFCPYAYKKGISVHAHDIAVNYNYFDADYYQNPLSRNWSYITVTSNIATYRYNETAHASSQEFLQPMATVKDGYWTHPYFDCGGGDIWMVTFVAPIFGFEPGTSNPKFVGLGSIDIELTNIDINQCDPDKDGTGGGSVDVFRGTHHCQPTTKCVALVGRGFIRGAYECECKPGFYFRDVNAKHKAFNGTIIEEYYATVNSSTIDQLEWWMCLRCAEGCDTCVDDTPCLYSLMIAIRAVFAILTLAITIIVFLISVIVAAYKNRKSIRSASPLFLHLMTTGAALMCVPMFIGFVEPTDLTCVLKIWPQHIGFALLYGALLLKTWRVSSIFKVKSARRLNLSDKVLAQRFVPILGVTVGYLGAWTGLGRPISVWRRTTADLKFKDCISDWWEYGAQAGEALFLLWGAYLCYVVRKAPSVYNESKYITWSIYNNILLGSFIIIIKQFIAIQQGPDVIYMVDFIYIQVSVTGTILLIFTHKLWGLRGKDSEEDTTVTGMSRGGKAPATVNDFLTDLVDVATQTETTVKVVANSPASPMGSRLLNGNNRVAPFDA